MQARPQEIRDRYNFITNNPDMVNNRVVYPTMRKITDDVGFLLDALEQAQVIIEGLQHQLEDKLEEETNTCLMCDKIDKVMLWSDNEGVKQQLKQAQYRERVLQELAQRRESVDIKSAKKFLGNSQFKQLCHITSELWECWKAWILWKIGKGRRSDLALELTDLQSSCQTMQEGPLGYTKDVIDMFRREVILKNANRGYDKPQQGSK